MYWEETENGYDLSIEPEDQCFDCQYLIKSRCPLIDALTDRDAIDFVYDEGMDVNYCQMYKPNVMRVIK